MVEFDVFRAELAAAFRSCARRRRESHDGHRAGSSDLRIAEQFDRLTADAENLDLHVFLLCQLAFTHAGLAERFYDVRNGLLPGITRSRPATATEFVREVLRRSVDDAPPTWETRCGQGDRACERPSRGSGTLASRPTTRARYAASAARDASLSWLGIVAPILSAWEFARGASQWSVQRSSDLRPAVPAMVVSAEPIPSLRHLPAAYDAVVSFRPSPASAGCEANLRIGGTAGPVAGTMLMVVPRSTRCQTPLIPSEIGDPFATWAVAAALMVAGVGALKLRQRLGTRLTARRLLAPPLQRTRDPEPRIGVRETFGSMTDRIRPPPRDECRDGRSIDRTGSNASRA